MESGETPRPVSASTWASSSVTIDTGRGSTSVAGSSAAGVGYSSPEVFLREGETSGAGRRPSSPLRNHLAVQHPQRQPRRSGDATAASAAAFSVPAGRDAPQRVSSPTTISSTAVTPPTHSSASSSADAEKDVAGSNVNAGSNDNEDDLLPMPALFDSDGPKSLLCIWAFVRSFFVDLFSILFNPVWLLLTMFTVGEVIVVDAFIVFGPKYIQTVFNVDASSANVLSGSTSGRLPRVGEGWRKYEGGGVL